MITLLFLHSLVNRTLHSPLKEFMGSQGNVWTSVSGAAVCCLVIVLSFLCLQRETADQVPLPLRTPTDHLSRIPVATKRNPGPLLLVAPLLWCEGLTGLSSLFPSIILLPRLDVELSPHDGTERMLAEAS